MVGSSAGWLKLKVELVSGITRAEASSEDEAPDVAIDEDSGREIELPCPGGINRTRFGLVERALY